MSRNDFVVFDYEASRRRLEAERILRRLEMWDLVRLYIAWIIMLATLFGCSAAYASVTEWRSLATYYEIQYNLPPGLLRSICERESHWHPSAIGAVGEVGLCQLKPDTVRKIARPGELSITLTFGSRGAAVYELQRALLDQGFDPGPIDGIFGPRTDRAVRLFQQSRALRSDGVVGPKTWTALLGHPPAADIVRELLDPRKNLEWAARYLVWLREQLGSGEPLILAAAYNGGPGHPMVRYLVAIHGARQLEAAADVVDQLRALEAALDAVFGGAP